MMKRMTLIRSKSISDSRRLPDLDLSQTAWLGLVEDE